VERVRRQALLDIPAQFWRMVTALLRRRVGNERYVSIDLRVRQHKELPKIKTGRYCSCP